MVDIKIIENEIIKRKIEDAVALTIKKIKTVELGHEDAITNFFTFKT